MIFAIFFIDYIPGMKHWLFNLSINELPQNVKSTLFEFGSIKSIGYLRWNLKLLPLAAIFCGGLTSLKSNLKDYIGYRF